MGVLAPVPEIVAPFCIHEDLKESVLGMALGRHSAERARRRDEGLDDGLGSSVDH
jgi:hypothetical protein